VVRRAWPKPRAARTTRTAFLGDAHAPHQDPVAVRLALGFLGWFAPQTLYLIGDIADFYQVSRFDKDPQRLLALQDDLDACVDFLADVRKAVGPRCRVVFLEGNHEDRLARYLHPRPEIAGLRSMRLPDLLGLGGLKIEHRPYAGPLVHPGTDFLVEHGDRVSRQSGATAKSMLDARGMSGISGHTHRLGAHYRTDEGGEKVWYENGCLCDVRPSYVKGRPNWQQGFSVMHQWGNRFEVEQVRVASGRIFYAGNLWQSGS
jgi:hypothetical protein